MDMEPVTECIVKGSLAFTLRVSQIAGLAPIRLKKSLGGWSVRLSPTIHYFDRFLISILCLLAISVFVLDASVNPEHSRRTRMMSTEALWAIDIGVVILVVYIASFTGLNRMRSIITCLMALQKINLKLSPKHRQGVNNRKRKIVLTSFLSVIIINTLFDYSIYTDRVIKKSDDYRKVIATWMYIFYYSLFIILEVVYIEFSEIVIVVLCSLQSLNSSLKSLLHDMQRDASQTNCMARLNPHNSKFNKSINSIIDTMVVLPDPIKTSPKSISLTIRRLSSTYCSICDVIRELNQSHGTMFAALLFSSLLHLIIAPYNTLVNAFTSGSSVNFTPLLVVWVLIHFCSLLLIIEPCHRAHEQMALTKHLVSQMTQVSLLENNVSQYELEIFYRLLILDEVTFSAAQMVTLDRDLVVRILGSITTYLVVVLQLRMEGENDMNANFKRVQLN